MQTTNEVVGTHGVYNFKPSGPFGVDERARVLVQLQKGKWTLLQ
jgi:branched-chain amino acid transport system substrate-binding protein